MRICGCRPWYSRRIALAGSSARNLEKAPELSQGAENLLGRNNSMLSTWMGCCSPYRGATLVENPIATLFLADDTTSWRPLRSFSRIEGYSRIQGYPNELQRNGASRFAMLFDTPNSEIIAALDGLAAKWQEFMETQEEEEAEGKKQKGKDRRGSEGSAEVVVHEFQAPGI